MDNRPRSERERDILAEPEKARLLERASELDVARASGAEVRELRAAAMEAGISPVAFDAAVDEIRSPPPTQVTRPANRRARILTFAVAALVSIVIGFVVNRRATPSGVPAGAGLSEQTVVLRCMSPAEAAELIRPILNLRENTVKFSESDAPQLLSVRVTPEQSQKIHALLDEKETGPAGACPAGSSRSP